MPQSYSILPAWLKVNFHIKAGLFLLAILLWFLVVTEYTYEVDLNVPIQVVGLKADRVIVSSLPKTADVKFQGSGRDIIRLQYLSQPHLRIDLSTISRFYIFRLKPEMVFVPGGIDAIPLDVVSPDSIQFVLREREEVKLPVKPVIKAIPAPGYTLAGDVVVTPEEVTVAGPKDRVGRLSYIATGEISLEGLRRNKVLDAALIPPSDRGYTLLPEVVRLEVKVERLTERVVRGVKLEARNKPSGRQVLIDPATVDVTVSGGVTVIAELVPGDLQGWVDYREYSPGGGRRVPVHIKPPDGVEISGATPPEVRLVIRRK